MKTRTDQKFDRFDNTPTVRWMCISQMRKMLFLLLLIVASFSSYAQTKKSHTTAPQQKEVVAPSNPVPLAPTPALSPQKIDHGSAMVNRDFGMYVFADCMPVAPYEVLGSVKGPALSMGSGQYDDVKKKLVTRAKNQYPDADGIILYFVDGGRDRADVIKFKP